MSSRTVGKTGKPAQHGHQARKRFGQNFLHDPHIIDRIIKAFKPLPGQHLLEIGPGQGALTDSLLSAGEHLDVIEVDRDLAAMLRQRYLDKPGFILHEADVLKFDFRSLDCPPHSLRIIGNLPYNISTPLLFHLLDYQDLIHDMSFMLQREVVDRMAAAVSADNYGRLSLMMQYHCKVERLFRVPSTAFTPQPKVESAIVKLTPWRERPFTAKNPAMLAQVVRTAFNQRRKTIRNSLKTLLPLAQLEALGIDINLRPENLSLADYVRISDSLQP
ncbi:MAG: 16S rRNA (adenine(1518)-N(6)/adenine(1519)-N(6))-dimethyltransferase RsmA [Pseudomonadales bacterium]|nr:16S rRNA (adenine(1518)-N(6)/adenine(1519)-N(6))-dimethyltransferase RsmA [Pseudomonadales bacterium]